jgi:hypothetical protein
LNPVLIAQVDPVVPLYVGATLIGLHLSHLFTLRINGIARQIDLIVPVDAGAAFINLHFAE